MFFFWVSFLGYIYIWGGGGVTLAHLTPFPTQPPAFFIYFIILLIRVFCRLFFRVYLFSDSGGKSQTSRKCASDDFINECTQRAQAAQTPCTVIQMKLCIIFPQPQHCTVPRWSDSRANAQKARYV